MLTRADLRKGRCPGALSPMLARDGLLVRLRISGGRLNAKAVRRIARASRDYGNGLCDLTSRSNLQLRGVSEGSLPHLIETLGGLIDEDAGAEAVRNVLISPLAGTGSAIDVAAIGKALEAALVGAKDLHRLPGKFGFLIDDGGPLSLADEPADVRFVYCEAQSEFSISIGGDADEAISLGVCAANGVVEISLALARAFLTVGASMPERPRRMVELIAACGPAAVARAAGLSLSIAPARKRPGFEAPSPIGLKAIGATTCFGAGAPLGRLRAEMLDAAADGAESFATGDIRMSPWRALLFPCVDPERKDDLRRHFAAANFIVDREDPRLAVAACGGASACERATTFVHDDALVLAPIARCLKSAGVALHVSGCAKGCARPRASPFTLVADAGLYDLVVDGASFDPSVAQKLTLAAAQEMLQAMADSIASGCREDRISARP
jgi:precorrin-3B synthase